MLLPFSICKQWIVPSHSITFSGTDAPSPLPIRCFRLHAAGLCWDGLFGSVCVIGLDSDGYIMYVNEYGNKTS